MKRIFFSILIAALLAACASKETKDTEVKVEDRPTPTAPVTAPPPTTKVKPPTVTPSDPKPVVSNPLDALNNPNSILSKRSIFYDYDSDAIKDEYKPLINAHSDFLKANRSVRMTIQGNTDERGSREYNIALGQRRADSVKKMMLLLGVQESQIETVSFGEEKPRAQGSDESAYSQNRRSDIAYVGEK